MHPRVMAERTMSAQQSAVESAHALAMMLGMDEEDVLKLEEAALNRQPGLRVLRLSEAVAEFLAKAVQQLGGEEEVKEEEELLGFLSEDIRAEVLAMFDSPDKLRAATVDELTEIKGIGPSTADKIMEYVQMAFGENE